MSQPEAEREAVKDAVRERDGFRCVRCGMSSEQSRERYGCTLHVHRTQPGSLYTLAGCVALCKGCHGPEPRRAGQPDEAYGDTFDKPKGRDIVPGFGLAVRTARESLGWSCARLGEAAGVSAHMVSAVETEKRAPSLRVASALVAALGLRVWLHDPATPAKR